VEVIIPRLSSELLRWWIELIGQISGEVVTRRNLPHWYVPNAFHFITFRLAGTIPREKLEELIAGKCGVAEQHAFDVALLDA
jgi:2'-5' RNA ligase